MREITIYRVRKSFSNIKSQKGAFFLFASAVKCAEKHRLNVYDNKGKLLFSGAEQNLYKRCSPPFTQGRLGEVPICDPRQREAKCSFSKN